jgi:hypothetical protein
MDNLENDILPVIKNWDLDEEQEKRNCSALSCPIENVEVQIKEKEIRNY